MDIHSIYKWILKTLHLAKGNCRISDGVVSLPKTHFITTPLQKEGKLNTCVIPLITTPLFVKGESLLLPTFLKNK